MNEMPSKGYRSKPVWIKLVSIVLILAPLGNIFISFVASGLAVDAGWPAWAYWLKQVSPKIWALNLLVFTAGLGLLWVRSWSLFLAFCAVGSALFYTTLNYQHYLLGPFLLGVMILVSMGLLALLIQKDFRKPYLNPRLRWWETSPRYRSDIVVQIRHANSKTPIKATLLDISRSGALVQSSDKSEISIGDHLHLEFSPELEIAAKVARLKEDHSFGVEFNVKGLAERKSIKTLVRQLELDPTSFLR